MQDKSNTIPPERSADQFLSLVMAHQRRIHAFILSLVPNTHDADDLLQETTLTMWRKYDSYEPGTDFLAWAFAVARFEVLSHRQKYARAKTLFNDDLLEELVQDTATRTSEFDAWEDALSTCLAKLKPEDQQLIKMRYQGGMTIKAVAQKIGRPVQGMYKVMARIHGALSDCAKQQLREGLS